MSKTKADPPPSRQNRHLSVAIFLILEVPTKSAPELDDANNDEHKFYYHSGNDWGCMQTKSDKWRDCPQQLTRPFKQASRGMCSVFQHVTLHYQLHKNAKLNLCFRCFTGLWHCLLSMLCTSWKYGAHNLPKLSCLQIDDPEFQSSVANHWGCQVPNFASRCS